MHFYSMGYSEVLALPLRAFWSLNAQISRLRAEANLSMFELFLLSSPNVDGNTIEQARKSLTDRMGEPMKTSIVPGHVSAEQHQEGVSRLRDLADRLGKVQKKDGGSAS